MAAPSTAHWESKRSEIRERYGLDALWSSFHPAKDGAPAHLSIDFMIVHPNNRGQGRGAAAAREILQWADDNNVIVTLTPQPEPGYKKKLTDWYKGMGFVMNKGRSKNFDYRETMIRYPRKTNPDDELKRALASASNEYTPDEMKRGRRLLEEFSDMLGEDYDRAYRDKLARQILQYESAEEALDDSLNMTMLYMMAGLEAEWDAREENPGDIDACALGKWAWDRDPKACGEDPPSPSDAAKRLAKKRWTARERWVAARLLRGES